MVAQHTIILYNNYMMTGHKKKEITNHSTEINYLEKDIYIFTPNSSKQEMLSG